MGSAQRRRHISSPLPAKAAFLPRYQVYQICKMPLIWDISRHSGILRTQAALLAYLLLFFFFFNEKLSGNKVIDHYHACCKRLYNDIGTAPEGIEHHGTEL